MSSRTQTPTFRSRARGAPSREQDPVIETMSGTPIPGPAADDDELPEGWLRSIVPAQLRPAADRVEDLGLWLLGSNAGLAIHATHLILGFCVWYTVLHGFFGISWCFGQAGHYREPDASPPVHHTRTPFDPPAKPAAENDGDASGGEEGR